MISAKLDAAIKAVCPIHGVSIGRLDDKSTWRVDFIDSATAPQRAAARLVVDQFDAVAAALPPSASELEAAALSALNGDATGIDILKLLKAKFVSDLAWRLGKAQGSLTIAELNAERSRIAAIYKAL